MNKYNEIPTTTALVVRMQVFEPTRRPKVNSKRQVVTKYGTASINGRLGQAHEDVLEAILFHVKEVTQLSQTMTITVDPYKIRMSAGGGTQFSGDQIEVLVKELMTAVIDIRYQNIKIFGHIIDKVEITNGTTKCPLGVSGIGNAERSMWEVTIGSAYLKILEDDLIFIRRDPKTIAKITHGISQAIVRFCLSHSRTPNGGWQLDTLIKSVSDGNNIRERRRDVKKDKLEIKNAGIIVDEGRVWIEKDMKIK